MSNVWVVIKDEGYGCNVEGVCSSKEKADAFIAASEEMYGCGDWNVVSYEIDEILEDVISDIEQSLGHYEKLRILLEHLKTES